MKKGTHPKYMKCDVICNCGENRGVLFTTRSTVPQIKVEICSFCHPFFTGKQKLVDSAGRVEKFNRKYAKRKPKIETVTAETVTAETLVAETVTAEAVAAETVTADAVVTETVTAEAIVARKVSNDTAVKIEEVKSEEVKTEAVKTEAAKTEENKTEDSAS